MPARMQSKMHRKKFLYLVPFVLLLFTACEKTEQKRQAESAPSTASIERTGWLKADNLLEVSGMQASHSREGDFFVHNDEGKPRLYVIDETGASLGHITIVPARNRDWEDITSIPVNDSRWIVAGDIGDNQAKRKSIKLYFIEEPKPGKQDRYSGDYELIHWLSLTYPDGPRDCESMAYDPVGKQLLLLSKRDKPPRLYAIDLETALSQQSADLTFLGTTSALRPPTPADRSQFGGRTDYISQPTGFDISPDGNEAVVITYRSLYRYQRRPGEDWLSALQRKPAELLGPPAVQNEAITYSTDSKSIYVTTEKQPAPVFKIEFTP